MIGKIIVVFMMFVSFGGLFLFEILTSPVFWLAALTIVFAVKL